MSHDVMHIDKYKCCFKCARKFKGYYAEIICCNIDKTLAMCFQQMNNAGGNAVDFRLCRPCLVCGVVVQWHLSTWVVWQGWCFYFTELVQIGIASRCHQICPNDKQKIRHDEPSTAECQYSTDNGVQRVKSVL